VLLVPHLASGTTETRSTMAELAIDNVIEVLAGGPPLTPVLAAPAARGFMSHRAVRVATRRSSSRSSPSRRRSFRRQLVRMEQRRARGCHRRRHGAYDRFVEILKVAGIVDSELRWIGGRTHVVQLGDLVDRGDDRGRRSIWCGGSSGPPRPPAARGIS
jgi:hypothetical protein